jgi:hypothetical protein
MTFQFKLEVVRMECVNEQQLEWGNDEMRMLGYGVSRKGHFFSTGYRKLGSYGTGDVKPPGAFPLTLFERELEDDGLEVLFFFWLVEEDGSGVRHSAAELDTEFRKRFFQTAESMTGNQFPRDCIPFLALQGTALPFSGLVENAGTEGRDDEVYIPVQALFRFEQGSAVLPVVTQDQTFRRSKHLGEYLITLRASYRHIDVIIQ